MVLGLLGKQCAPERGLGSTPMLTAKKLTFLFDFFSIPSYHSSMKLLNATIILSDGHDHVNIHTDQPSTFPKVTDQNLTLTFTAQRDFAQAYLAAHFPDLPVRIINDRRPKTYTDYQTS